MKLKRWLALDCFKAVAIFVMIAWHLSIWWINLNPSIEKGLLMVGVTPWPYLLQIIVAFSGHFSMSIPIVAGAALRLYLEKNIDKNPLDRKKFLLAITKRAIALAFLGFAVNLLAFGPTNWYLWNVLQLISLSMLLIIFFISYSPVYSLAISGFAVIFTAPFIRGALQDNNSYLAFTLIGDKLGDNIWSFFPWYGVIVYGFLMVHFYLYFKNKKQEGNFKLALVSASLLLIGLALLKNRFFYAVDLEYPWGYLLFQPPTLTVLAQLSVFNVTLIIMDFIFSKITRLRKFGVINVFSRGILWIYVVHMIVGFRLIEFLINKNFQSLITLFFVMFFIFVLCYGIGLVSILKKENAL